MVNLLLCNFQSHLQTMKEDDGLKFKIVELNLKLLNASGMIPSGGIKSTVWKSRLYSIYQIFQYLLYFPILLSQLLALYYNKNDIIVLIDNICALTIPSSSYIAAILLKFKGNAVFKLIQNVENSYIYDLPEVKNNEKCIEALKSSKKMCRIMFWFTIGSGLSGMFFWVLSPILLDFAEQVIYDESNSNDRNTTENKFVFAMWLPFELESSSSYVTVYIVQTVIFFVSGNALFGFFAFSLTLLIHAANQFEIVTLMVKDIDDELSKYATDEFHSNTLPLKIRFKNQNEITKLRLDVYKTSPYYINTKLNSRGREYEKEHAMELYHRNTSNVYYFKTDLKIEMDAEEHHATNYLRQVAKAHQIAIQNMTNTEEIIGLPLFCITFLALTCIVGSTFILSMNPGFQQMMKSFATLTFALAQFFFFCIFGEAVITQSLAVGEAAYSCQWFERGPAFKRLLLIVLTKAHKPVYLTLGKLLIQSMEMFAWVVQSSYKFFNLLLQMNEQI
ncbi:Odorant receptor 32 [Blattella germanica]|nr:Odorant receptor 32 [Blattella germanica]